MVVTKIPLFSYTSETYVYYKWQQCALNNINVFLNIDFSMKWYVVHLHYIQSFSRRSTYPERLIVSTGTFPLRQVGVSALPKDTTSCQPSDYQPDSLTAQPSDSSLFNIFFPERNDHLHDCWKRHPFQMAQKTDLQPQILIIDKHAKPFLPTVLFPSNCLGSK